MPNKKRKFDLPRMLTIKEIKADPVGVTRRLQETFKKGVEERLAEALEQIANSAPGEPGEAMLAELVELLMQSMDVYADMRNTGLLALIDTISDQVREPSALLSYDQLAEAHDSVRKLTGIPGGHG